VAAVTQTLPLLRGLPAIEWGAAGRARTAGRESGDRFVVQPFTDGVLVAALDGLGHGARAAAAADAAAALLQRHAHEPVDALVERCHEALGGTRGVVMSLASIHASDRGMTWLGVGNVEGVLARADPGAAPPQELLLLRAGVVGEQLPPLQPARLALSGGDLLLFATDGIRSGFAADLPLALGAQRLADRILARNGRESDDALVLVVRFLGAAA
jgi:hypothetical protein